MRTIAFVIFFGALGACDPAGPNGNGDCTGSDCPTDPTKPKPGDKFAYLELNIAAGDEAAPCNVFMDGLLIGYSGDGPIEIPAGKEVTLQVGNGDEWTEENNTRPIHDLEGVKWVYPDIVIDASPDETIEHTANLVPYYHGTNVVCEVYSHNSGNTYEYEEGEVGVRDGYKLYLQTIGSGSWLDLRDGLKYVGDLADVEITEYEFGIDTINWIDTSSSMTIEYECQF